MRKYEQAENNSIDKYNLERMYQCIKDHRSSLDTVMQKTKYSVSSEGLI